MGPSAVDLTSATAVGFRIHVQGYREITAIYSYIRPLLFRLDPESAHSLTLQMVRLAGALAVVRDAFTKVYYAPGKPVEAFGLTFPNCVGLAAGYDKDGLGFRGLATLGFGHIELGTVTPLPQPGNPRPRVFRLVEDRALINRMGFPGKGADHLVRRLAGRRREGIILGVNLGVNKETPLQKASEDYLKLLRVFAPMADYLVVNVSSPNTVGLRQLQARGALKALLDRLGGERQIVEQKIDKRVPLLVKLSPDLTGGELEDALEVIIGARFDGVVASNTTVSRMDLRSKKARELGGLSGEPLKSKSTETIHQIHNFTGGKLPIIGVGGIMNASDAREKLEAGATLVQVYTGLIYEGPGLVKNILEDIIS